MIGNALAQAFGGGLVQTPRQPNTFDDISQALLEQSGQHRAVITQPHKPLFNSAFELLRYEQVVLGVPHWVRLREAAR